MTSRAGLLRRAAPLALLALLTAAILAPSLPGLGLVAADRARADAMVRELDQVPASEGLVVVSFDPDLGTYAEIRSTVRLLMADLLQRGVRLALVSFTPEGRALAVAELERLRDDTTDDQLFDLGYRPGAEAALVRAVQRPTSITEGPLARLAAGGLGAADLVLLVGGNDLGPRSWVEQVATRLPDLRLAAVTPAVLLPELEPYLASGQLDALLGTIHDGSAFRATVDPSVLAASDARPIGPLPVLVGLIVALVLLGQVLAVRARRELRSLRG